jgi:hypothetical protein
MFKRVDIVDNEKLKGFSYINKDGDEESVSLPVGLYGLVDISVDDNEVRVYKEDIPKLIKALEAVYNYKD